MRYISELERKVQGLQTEATTLSAQLTMLQVCIYLTFVYLLHFLLCFSCYCFKINFVNIARCFLYFKIIFGTRHICFDGKLVCLEGDHATGFLLTIKSYECLSCRKIQQV